MLKYRMDQSHYQISKPHLLPRAEQEKHAMNFCEGNENYRKFLLRLWGSGVDTYAGCGGILENHEPEWHYASFAYIAIRCLPETKDLLDKFVVNLRKQKFHERYVLKIENESIILRIESLRRIGKLDHDIRFTKQECENFFKELIKTFDATIKRG